MLFSTSIVSRHATSKGAGKKEICAICPLSFGVSVLGRMLSMNFEPSQEQITPIGITNWRNQSQRFGIKDKDRLGHIYVIGKTGVGKSTLLQSMAISDIERGNGLGIIDPHGDIAEDILNFIPQHRIEDVIYFNPADTEYPIAFNLLANVAAEYHHLAASGLISTFKKIWAESWGPRLEHILRFSLLTLLEYGEATLLDIQPLLTNPLFREKVLNRITGTHLIAFWRNEFEKYAPALRNEAIAPILNKMGLFIASIPLRNTVGQRVQSFEMRAVLDEGKIFIANLSKGKLGEDASSLLGSMLVTSMQLAALSRSDQEPDKRRPFYLYIDEVQSFISLAFADILAEARKYGLSLFMAHQYIEQLHEKVRSAIFGNVGTMIVFRVGAEDAKYLAPEFSPVFNEEDLVSLPKYSMYLKLMIDGATSRAYSADSLSLSQVRQSFKPGIIDKSRKAFAKREEDIKRNFQYGEMNPDAARNNATLF